MGQKGPIYDVGPVTVDWGATAILEIFGEVRWTLTGENAEVMEMINGATPVDTVFLGYSACSITIPMTRNTLATLQPLLPRGSLPAADRVEVSAVLSSGISHVDNGLPLFVKPVSAGTAVANGSWLRLEYTYPTPNYDVVFDLRTQRAYGITFQAHPTADRNVLWQAGMVQVGTSY